MEETPGGGKFHFDPFGWAEKAVGEKRLHLLIRLFMAYICLALAAWRLRDYKDYISKPLWFAETFLFVVLAAAYLRREFPADRARGAKRIIVPIIGGLLPFALLTVPPNPLIWKNPTATTAVLLFMTFSTALTVWGMWALGKSFSITVEARTPVSRGPYRFVRHPIYLGEILSAAGVAVWRLSIPSALLLALFAAVQLYRSRQEEIVLLASFPEYKKVLDKSCWFW